MSVDDYCDGICPVPKCGKRLRRPLDTKAEWSGYDVIAGNRHWHEPPPVTVIERESMLLPDWIQAQAVTYVSGLPRALKGRGR